MDTSITIIVSLVKADGISQRNSRYLINCYRSRKATKFWSTALFSLNCYFYRTSFSKSRGTASDLSYASEA
ncbi:hypothetical protein CRYUN_Cryun20dG0053800 [Craigia yunnanensis]